MARTMAVSTLLNGVTGTGLGPLIEIEPARAMGDVKSLPLAITGITSATVVIRGGFDENRMAIFSSGSFTSDEATTMPFFPYIQAEVTSYSSGTIYAEVAI